MRIPVCKVLGFLGKYLGMALLHVRAPYTKLNSKPWWKASKYPVNLGGGSFIIQ